MEIPFIFGKIAMGENFTDREEETHQLENNFNSCINTIIISPRRWGKSSLVHKAAKLAERNNPRLKVCYIDLLNVLNVEEFYILYATEIIKATSSKWEEFIGNAKKFLSSLIPKVSMSALPGEEISLSFDIERLRLNPDEVLDLPEKIAVDKGYTIAVCIDEFQKVAEWKDSNYLQGKFRSKWQFHQHVGYCLFGSKRHMMMEIFTDSSKPFYRFGDLIFLKKIPRANMIEFIQERFKETHKQISEPIANLIVSYVNDHPYYCQQLAQLSWLRTQEICDERIVKEAHKSLVEQLSLLFTNLTEDLTVQQLNYLKALLNGEKGISSTETMARYGISSATSVNRSKKELIRRDILDNIEGNVQFLDPVYEYWLKHTFFKIPYFGE
ncbi:MAG: ATP-binding protein [Muribaculaceae bacterium]|nr:ATP-binding protein [Muribaculaceae bacterium]